jgi:hypothetical protein
MLTRIQRIMVLALLDNALDNTNFHNHIEFPIILDIYNAFYYDTFPIATQSYVA